MEKVNRIRVANIPVPAAKTTPWAIPDGCKWFTLQCRTAVNVKISRSESIATYITLKSGTSWYEHDLDIEERIQLFFYADSAVVIEVLLGIYEEEEV